MPLIEPPFFVLSFERLTSLLYLYKSLRFFYGLLVKKETKTRRNNKKTFVFLVGQIL